MGLLTKISKPKADYHQWAASELSNGDIIDVIASLGRPASFVTIESIGGASTLRFNVAHQIRKNHEEDNPWIPDSAFWTKPGIVDEIEQVKDNIVIEANSTQTWVDREIRVRDIKIITKAVGLKITVR